MDAEKLATLAIGCGIEVHKALGPGLLESAYEAVLAEVLMRRGCQVERQKTIGIQFEDIVIDNGFRADLLINGILLIELKSVDRLAPIHGRQLLTYLRLMKMPLGLLMYFNVTLLVDGIKRVVNDHRDVGSSPLRINQNIDPF